MVRISSTHVGTRHLQNFEPADLRSETELRCLDLSLDSPFCQRETNEGGREEFDLMKMLLGAEECQDANGPLQEVIVVRSHTYFRSLLKFLLQSFQDQEQQVNELLVQARETMAYLLESCNWPPSENIKQEFVGLEGLTLAQRFTGGYLQAKKAILRTYFDVDKM